MAQKISVLLVNDIDGSQADETIPFGLDGTHYEIDLNSKHAQELRGQLERYVSGARKATRSTAQPVAGPPQTTARTRKYATGPKSETWRSTTAAASPPISRHSTRPKTASRSRTLPALARRPPPLSIHLPLASSFTDPECTVGTSAVSDVPTALLAGTPCENKHCQQGSRIVTLLFRRTPDAADMNQLNLCQSLSRRLPAVAQVAPAIVV